ncbi:MAG: hypothetical protein HYR55_18380 [Acidobacteria bacterium]|nr:hypothetical protein [Acidobacteriota bacterium]
MTDKETELIALLQKAAAECRAYPNAQTWADWFEKDKRALQLALENNRVGEKAPILADLRRALWGGMGAFCDGGAPNMELEKLGQKIYRLIADIEQESRRSNPVSRLWGFLKK